jgi:histidinol dehydrogenase
MANTYKVLGQGAPADTSNADLYTVPSGTATVVSTIHVANVTADVALARIYIMVAGAPASDSNAIAKDVELAANSIFAMTEGMTLGAGDVIAVRSSVANALTFHAFGSEVI